MVWWLALFSFSAVHAACPEGRYEVRQNEVRFIVPAAADRPEKSNRLETSDYADFSLLPPVRACSEFIYARDKTHVFLNGEAMKDADPEGFRVERKDDAYSLDRHRAFYRGKKISEAEAEGFVAVALNYAKDTKRAFYKNLSIPEADPATFAAFGPFFAADQTRVFAQTEAFPRASFKSFGHYSRLGGSIFYRDVKIPGARAASFKILSADQAADDHATYRGAESK